MNSAKKEIDISGLTTGIYFVKVRNDKGNILFPKVKFIFASELIDLIMKTQGYGYKEDIEFQLKNILNSDLLIIDDIFDEAKGTYWKSNPDLVIGAWDKFLRRQLSEEKRIILTSNTTMTTIQKKFGESLYELISRNFYDLQFTKKIKDEKRKKKFDNLWGN